MNVVAVSVGEAFFNKVTAVACSIDSSIACSCRNRAFESSFERSEAILSGNERKIVDKDDEFQRIGAYAFDNIGNITKLFLCYFDKTQSSICKFVYNSFDR